MDAKTAYHHNHLLSAPEIELKHSLGINRDPANTAYSEFADGLYVCWLRY